MSNQSGLSGSDASVGGSVTDTAVPAEGEAPTTGGEGTPEATPEPSYLDLDQYKDHHVRVRVDGEEVEVPLSEALGGYSRTADYTRKTQALAERERQVQFGLTLQQALENNPEETLRILQSQYTQPTQEAEPDWTDDPTDQRYKALEDRLSHWEQQQAAAELRQAVGVLQQRYGEEFDAREVVARASAMGRIDLEAVYKEMAFDRYWQGQQEARKTQQAEEAARVNAKTEAGSIHQGNGANNTVAPETGSFPTIEEAFAEAKRQLGWQ
jgi:hypothetical protein